MRPEPLVLGTDRGGEEMRGQLIDRDGESEAAAFEKRFAQHRTVSVSQSNSGGGRLLETRRQGQKTDGRYRSEPKGEQKQRAPAAEFVHGSAVLLTFTASLNPNQSG